VRKPPSCREEGLFRPYGLLKERGGDMKGGDFHGEEIAKSIKRSSGEGNNRNTGGKISPGGENLSWGL